MWPGSPSSWATSGRRSHRAVTAAATAIGDQLLGRGRHREVTA
ncbi:MAG TPA: hypothetical protein VF469_24700 [Kofleriaceae bacterium]